jgi:tetratricopeptide (TPR) repeat protein
MALLDDGRERFCHDAAALLCRALYVADTNGDSLLARTVASFCYLALTVAMYRRGVDTLYADVAAEKITNLRTRFGSLVLRQGLNADDLARAAYNAAQQQAFDAAAQLFDDALSREPRHQRASYYHGCVAFNTHDYAQAVDSLSIALQTNEIESRKHRLALEETDPRDRIGLQEARAEIERQTDLWRHEISTRARAFALSGQMVQAQNDVNALISHDDESVDAWKLAAAVHNALGDQTAAHNAFTKVLMHTSDPAERTALQAQIAQLQQGID